jgi:hypothetical protein
MREQSALLSRSDLMHSRRAASARDNHWLNPGALEGPFRRTESPVLRIPTAPRPRNHDGMGESLPPHQLAIVQRPDALELILSRTPRIIARANDSCATRLAGWAGGLGQRGDAPEADREQPSAEEDGIRPGGESTESHWCEAKCERVLISGASECNEIKATRSSYRCERKAVVFGSLRQSAADPSTVTLFDDARRRP